MSTRGSLDGVKARGLENDTIRCIEHVGIGMKFNRDWGKFTNLSFFREKLEFTQNTCKSTKNLQIQ